MAFPYYIDGSINTDTGTGTSGDPFGSWTQFVTTVGAVNLTGLGVCIVYIKNKCTTGNVSTGRFTYDTPTNGSSSNYLKFMPWTGFEGDGTVANTPGFQASNTTQYEYLFRVPTWGMVEGLCFNQLTTGNKPTLDMFTRANTRANRCIIKSVNNGVCVRLLGDSTYIKDSLIISAAGNGIYSSDSPKTITVHGCTIVTTSAGGTAVDPHAASCTADVRNCAMYGSWTTECGTTGLYAAACTNNAGQTATASQPTNMQLNYVQLTSDPFNNLAGADYRPKAGSALLAPAGSGGVTTNDLLNAARASPSAIGAFENAPAAAIVTPSATNTRTVLGAVHQASSW